MDFFQPATFFDLASFEHAALFDPNEPVWVALKKIESYIRAMGNGKIQAKIENGAFLVKPEEITIGAGTIVEAGSYISGPCIIGKNCQIRHGAYIRGNVVVGNQCVIGHASEVKSAIFLNESHAGHFAYVGDSILGNRVNLGAGTKCANLRFDKKNVKLLYKGQKIDTGLRKLGAILGDDVQTGCNSVTNPGTLMGKKTYLLPCMNVSGIVFEKTKSHERASAL